MLVDRTKGPHAADGHVTALCFTSPLSYTHAIRDPRCLRGKSLINSIIMHIFLLPVLIEPKGSA